MTTMTKYVLYGDNSINKVTRHNICVLLLILPYLLNFSRIRKKIALKLSIFK